MSRFQKYISILQRYINDMRSNRFVIIILTIAICSRILAILIFGDFKKPYLYEYGVIARNMVAGNGYSMFYPPLEPANPEAADYHFTIAAPPTAFTLPGIVIVYYIVLSIFNESFFSIILFYLLNLIAAAISLIGLYYLVGMILSEIIARWSLLIASIYPVFIFAVTTFGGTVYYHAVSISGFIVLYQLIKKQTIASAWIAGIVGAVWMYFRPEMLFVSPVLGYYIWKKTKLHLAAIYFSLIIICAAPWTIRNYIAYNSFIPLTTNSWLNFWRGNNLETSGGSWSARGDANWYNQDILKKIKQVPQSCHMEIDISHIYRDESMNYLTAHPTHVVLLFLKKYLMFWTTDYSDPRAQNLIYLISYGVLLLTFIAGFISLRKARRIPVPIFMFIGIYSVLVSLLHVEIRYQTYVSLMYIPFAAYFVSNFFKNNFTPVDHS